MTRGGGHSGIVEYGSCTIKKRFRIEKIFSSSAFSGSSVARGCLQWGFFFSFVRLLLLFDQVRTWMILGHGLGRDNALEDRGPAMTKKNKKTQKKTVIELL